MANNYLEFSEVIDNLTPKELSWWQKQAERITKIYDNDENWADDYDPYDDESMCNDFSVNPKAKEVWFHSDECGDIEKVAYIVKKFLSKFRQNDCFSLTWACWCSKPRIGEFDGGGLFVTSNDIQYHSSYEWIEDTENDWKKNR